jgi:hypothetical protein
MSCSRTALLLGFLTACPGPGAAAAQLVRGSVVEHESRRPVAGATLTVREHERFVAAATSDDAGRFLLRLPRAGEYVVSVEHVAFRPRTLPLPGVDEDEEVTILVELAIAAVELQPIRVTARRPAGASFLDGLYARAAVRRPRNDGRTILREDMQDRSVSQVSDYLAQVPGLLLRNLRGGRERYPVLLRSGRQCLPTVYLNGSLIDARDIDTFAVPGSLEGIEVYNQGDEPVEYRDLDPLGCGVILLWTPLRTEGQRMDRRRVVVLSSMLAATLALMLIVF